MLDFKKWQMINEALVGTGFSLGLSQTPQVGGLLGKFQFLDEKKKNMGKDAPVPDEEAVEGDDEDMDDEEAVDDDSDDVEDGDDEGDDVAAPEEKKPVLDFPKFAKKKMKNECDCDGKKGKDVEAGDDMDDEAEDDVETDADADMGGDEAGDDEEGGKKVMRPLGFMKKKMAKKMKKESVDEFLANLAKEYATPAAKPAEEDEFWASMNHYKFNPNQKFSDGFSEYQEDYLIQAKDETPAAQAEEPKAGEVGFAPQQKMDMGYELPPLEEGQKPKRSWLI